MRPTTTHRRPTDARDIPIGLIRASATNPRKTFDEAKLAELAGSIGTVGILEPLVVRRSKDAEGEWELVLGERRLRAARLVKLESVPCVVVDLEDVVAVEAQVIENLHREEVAALKAKAKAKAKAHPGKVVA